MKLGSPAYSSNEDEGVEFAGAFGPVSISMRERCFGAKDIAVGGAPAGAVRAAGRRLARVIDKGSLDLWPSPASYFRAPRTLLQLRCAIDGLYIR
jgi:hypothetical protein